MAPKQATPHSGLTLPSGLISPGDVRRLLRELADLEDTLRQIRLRTKAPASKLPRASQAIETFAATNRLDLLVAAEREKMKLFLETTATSAPVLHLSFAAEASRSFTTRLVLWLRSNIDPLVLVEVGLEPTIAAGCILRTANKQFDFSLRARFERQATLLSETIKQPAAPAGGAEHGR